jgi:hypothetical protein
LSDLWPCVGFSVNPTVCADLKSPNFQGVLNLFDVFKGEGFERVSAPGSPSGSFCVEELIFAGDSFALDPL